MVNTQLKIDKVLGALEYFTTHEWNFRTGNMWIVWDALSEEDQQVRRFILDNQKLHRYLFTVVSFIGLSGV